MSPPDTALPATMALDMGFPVSLRRDLGGIPPGLAPGGMPGDATMFLLRDALARLKEAEATIAEQRERIDHLETLSLTDELTGLLNRRGFMDAARRALAGARRSGRGGVLVMVDLDGFKGINDTHGHLCGDQYLRQVAKVLEENVRGHDVVARLGGDEFVILLTGTDDEPGLARAKALSDLFNAAACPWQRGALPLRASFGTQPYGPKDKLEDVMRKADAGMYKAKASRKAKR